MTQSNAERAYLRASWLAGLFSVLIPGLVVFGSHPAVESGERACGLIMLGGVLAGAALGSILSLAALILAALSAYYSAQPLNNRRRFEIILLGLPLAAGLIFFTALVWSRGSDYY